MNKAETVAYLRFLGACKGALSWVEDQPEDSTPKTLWDTCPRADWVFWAAEKAGVAKQVLQRTATACYRHAYEALDPNDVTPADRDMILKALRLTSGAATAEDLAGREELTKWAGAHANTCGPGRWAYHMRRGALCLLRLSSLDVVGDSSLGVMRAVYAVDEAEGRGYDYPDASEEAHAQVLAVLRAHSPWEAVDAVFGGEKATPGGGAS